MRYGVAFVSTIFSQQEGHVFNSNPQPSLWMVFACSLFACMGSWMDEKKNGWLHLQFSLAPAQVLTVLTTAPLSYSVLITHKHDNISTI